MTIYSGLALVSLLIALKGIAKDENIRL
jgi:hypothetical protein